MGRWCALSVNFQSPAVVAFTDPSLRLVGNPRSRVLRPLLTEGLVGPSDTWIAPLVRDDADRAHVVAVEVLGCSAFDAN